MANNLLGQAIYCDCYIPDYKRYKVIGSITAEGILEILRSHENKTYLQVQEFIISCEHCGFRKYIKLESMAINRPA